MSRTHQAEQYGMRSGISSRYGTGIRPKGDLVLTGGQHADAPPRPSINIPEFEQPASREHPRMDRSPSTRQQFYRHSRAENLGDYNQAIEGEAGERKP